MEPIFTTKCFGFITKVYPSYIKYSLLWGSGGSQTIPINQIASIEMAMPGVQQVKIETTGGKVYKLVIYLKAKEDFVKAVYEAMGKK